MRFVHLKKNFCDEQCLLVQQSYFPNYYSVDSICFEQCSSVALYSIVPYSVQSHKLEIRTCTSHLFDAHFQQR